MGAIASFYAEIGVNTTGLQTGLKNAKTQMQSFGKGVNDAAQRLTGLNLTQISTAGLLYSGAKLISDSVKGWISYANAMQDAARLTGTTTEEMSRLTQVADDVRISQEQLKTAMQIASRQGIDVSIDGLKRLSDQYLALNPGVERAQFLLQTFGRSGAEVGRLMELGGDKIGKYASAVSDSLVVTAEAAKKAEAARLAMDNLNDTWTGMKNTLAQAVIPALNKFLTLMNDGIETGTRLANWNKDINNFLEDHEKEVLKTAKSYEEYRNEMIRSYIEAGKLTGQQGKLAGELRAGTLSAMDTTYATRQLTDQFGWLNEQQFAVQQTGKTTFGLINDMGEGARRASSKLDGAAVSMGGMGRAAGELDDVLAPIPQRIADIYTPAWEAAEAFGELTKQELFHKAAAELDGPAQIELARQMGLLNETAAAELTALDLLKKAKDEGRISTDQYKDAVANLKATVDSLMDKSIKVTVDNLINTTYTYSGIAPDDRGTQRWGGFQEEFANGGVPPVGVPSLVGERGPELFIPGMTGQVVSSDDIITALRQMQGGSTGNAGNTTNYSLTMNVQKANAESVAYGFRTLQLLEGV